MADEDYNWRLDPYGHSQNNPRLGSPITWVMVVMLLILVGLFAYSALTADDEPERERPRGNTPARNAPR